jgi:hypothetical protein
MPDEDRIDRWARSILAGTNLPVPRRKEVAAEWASHIRSLAQANREEGLDAGDAILAAFDAFGAPHILRAGIQREQRALVRSSIWMRMRSGWAMATAAQAAIIAFIVLIARPAAADVVNLIPAAALLVATLAAMAYHTMVIDIALNSETPADEFSFVRSLLRWSIRGAVGLGLIALIAGLEVMLLGAMIPGHILAASTPAEFAILLIESAISCADRSTPIAVAGIVALATTAVLYERSNCTESWQPA